MFGGLSTFNGFYILKTTINLKIKPHRSLRPMRFIIVLISEGVERINFSLV